MDEEVRFYPSRAKLVLFSGLGAVFAGVGAVVAIVQPEGPVTPTFARAIGWIALAMFGTVTLWLVYRLVTRRPLLVVSGEGLVDRASAAGAGFIAWSEVEEIRLLGARPHRFLAVIPKDPKAFAAKRPWIHRVASRMNRVAGFPPVALPAAWFPMSLEDVLGQIRQFDPDVPSCSPTGTGGARRPAKGVCASS